MVINKPVAHFYQNVQVKQTVVKATYNQPNHKETTKFKKEKVCTESKSEMTIKNILLERYLGI